METPVINRDLVRWERRHWFWCIAFLLCTQLGLLFSMTRPLQVRSVYPSDPVLELPAASASKSSGEWLELEDPMLFAAPSWRGVSGLAWLRKPDLELFQSREFPPVAFLNYREAAQMTPREYVDGEARAAVHSRPAPQLFLPVVPPPSSPRESKLEIDGFGARRPISMPALPVQFHNDVVRRTVVQAGVDPDGVVFSSRVTGSSGSKQADAAAINIARKLRFEPLTGTRERPSEIAWGKLIFEWHALDLGTTNAVRR